MYFSIMGKGSLKSAGLSIVKRIFLSQHTGTILSLEYFPEYKNYLYGKNYIPFNSKINLKNSKRYSRYLMKHYYSIGEKKGVAGVMTSSFIAGGYANFGYLGILIGIFVVSIWFVILQFLFFRLEYNPITISFLIFIMFLMSFNANRNLRLFIYYPSFIILFFVVVFLLFLIRKKPVVKFRKINY